MKQKFKKGSVALLKNRYGEDFRVKILECIQDEDGDWYYEVTPTDWTPIWMPTREVPQKALEAWEA